MRRRTYFLLLFVGLLVCVFPAAAYCLEWNVEMVAGLGVSDSIAVDSSNSPHISYKAGHPKDPYLWYANRDNSGWHNSSIVSTGAHTGAYYWGHTSIDVDSFDNPHISYCALAALEPVLNYITADNSGWNEPVAVDSMGIHSCLKLDSFDNPHIAYDASRHAAYDGDSWNIESIPGFGSMDIDSSDNLHLSYCDINGNLKYASNSGSGWQVTTINSGDNACSSIAIGPSGNPGIVYTDKTDPENRKLKYSLFHNNMWHTEVVEDLSGVEYSRLGKCSSIAFDAFGNPRLLYYGFHNEIRFAFSDGAAWNIDTVAVGSYASLALDSDGNPHICYTDTAYSLQYAAAVVPEPSSFLLLGLGLTGLFLKSRAKYKKQKKRE